MLGLILLPIIVLIGCGAGLDACYPEEEKSSNDFFAKLRQFFYL